MVKARDFQDIQANSVGAVPTILTRLPHRKFEPCRFCHNFIHDKGGVIIGCLIDNYSEQSLKAIASLSNSMAELARNLGYRTSHGKNYATIEKRLQQYDISIDHFKQTSKKHLSDEDIFCQNSIASQHAVRNRYARREDIKYACALCGIGDIWNGKPLTLQLDHIDGNNKNNTLENLQWLCPNCHSQTKTFAGKNIVKERMHCYCVDCGKEINNGSKRCQKCSNIMHRKATRPSKEELEGLLRGHNGNFKEVADLFQVTDNTIRKWCKSYNISYHSTDYKSKKQVKETGLAFTWSVNQVDPNTNEILHTYQSTGEAERITGIKHIYAASDPDNKLRKTAGGYRWDRVEKHN